MNNIVQHILSGQIDRINWRRPPRGGREEEELINLRSELEVVEFSNQVDCLQWSLTNSGIYTVKSLRSTLDNLILLPSDGDEFKWNKLVPIKVNILFWRVWLNRIPTRLNLQNKGIICPSIMCPLCDLEAEDINHLFYRCSLAKTLWSKVMEWWGLIFHQDLSMESIWCTVSAARLQGLAATVFDAIFRSVIWLMWSCRNDKVFDSADTSHASPFVLFRKLQAVVFNWVVCRCNKLSLVWLDWLFNPRIACTRLVRWCSFIV